MAHIAVYLQRTPDGLHPASAVALCWARDIGSARGATVTAVCQGDAGSRDQALIEAAGRFGADVLLFCGPSGMANLRERLNPVHVLVPWTPEGRAFASDLPEGPIVPRWIKTRSPPFASADAVTGVIAGVLPWHRFEADVEAEYEGDVDDAKVELLGWPEASDAAADVFRVDSKGPAHYVAPPGVDPLVLEKLAALGASAATWEEAVRIPDATVLVLAPSGSGLTPPAEARPLGSRLLVLPGPSAAEEAAAWEQADWVLPGRWPDVLDALLEGPWLARAS